MRILLRLKHWQLFLITWAPAIALNIFSFSDPFLMLKLFPIMMIIFTIGIFGWVWAIATELHKKQPPGITLNLATFKILFSTPIAYMLIIIAGMSYTFYLGPVEGIDNMGPIVAIVVFVHLFSMACIFLGLRFAAKTMKSVELGRMAKFGDYAGEFFMMWFSPIGVWILQPRLNKLTDTTV